MQDNISHPSNNKIKVLAVVLAINCSALVYICYQNYLLTKAVESSLEQNKIINDKLFSFNVYFEEQKGKWDSELASLKNINSEEMKKLAGAVLYSYDDFDKKSKAMANWLVDTENRIKSIVSVYDKNVEIYKQQFTYLQNQINSLQTEVNRHREIFIALSRVR